MGENPPNGAVLLYHLAEKPDKETEIKLEILDNNETVIRTVTNKSGKPAKSFGGSYRATTIPAKKGMNRFIWNYRINDLSTVPDVSFYGGYAGYRVGPGYYSVRLTIGDESMSQSLEVRQDPRVEIRDRDSKVHQNMLSNLYGQIDNLHQSIVKARNIREQIKKMNELLKSNEDLEDLIQAGEKAIEAIDAWEGNVVQTKMETFQDVVNFLNRLNAHMLDLLSTIDSSDPPLTQGQRIRFSDLSEEWQSYKKKLDDILNEEVQEYNQLYKHEGLPAVIIPEK